MELTPAGEAFYRYAAPSEGIVDGQMFAFRLKDHAYPEMALILEARSTDGETRWHGAAVRLTWAKMRLDRDGAEFWSVSSATASPGYRFDRLEDVPQTDLFQSAP